MWGNRRAGRFREVALWARPIVSSASLFAVAAAAGYGAADFLGGLASRHATTTAVILVSQGLALVLGLCAAPWLPGAPGAADLLWGAAAGLAYSVGLVLLYRGLATGQMSVVAPITGICAPALPVLFGLLGGERPGAWALGGVLLAGVSIYLVSREPAAKNEVATRAGAVTPVSRGVVLLAIGGGLAFGVFLTTMAKCSEAAGLWPVVAARAMTVSCQLTVALVLRPALRLERRALGVALAGGALDMIANVFYLLATRGALLSLAATVTSLYPAATVLLASLVLGERIHRQRGVGLLCAVTSVVLITVPE